MKAYVYLNGINVLKRFEDDIANINADIDAAHGRYIIDAKSIMGMFSLDLSKPVELILHSENPEIINQFKDLVSNYRGE